MIVMFERASREEYASRSRSVQLRIRSSVSLAMAYDMIDASHFGIGICAAVNSSYIMLAVAPVPTRTSANSPLHFLRVTA